MPEPPEPPVEEAPPLLEPDAAVEAALAADEAWLATEEAADSSEETTDARPEELGYTTAISLHSPSKTKETYHASTGVAGDGHAGRVCKSRQDAAGTGSVASRAGSRGPGVSSVRARGTGPRSPTSASTDRGSEGGGGI